jgi:DNA helicase II / ATP-dependent DNA helicase PcrA
MTADTLPGYPILQSPVGADRSTPVAIDGVRALLKGLDRRQRQAVIHADGPLLVVAGPGTGKTEVITRRVAWLIATKRARPSEILALTFTERAAEQMQARVDLLVPYGQADTAIHTFHAFGDWFLREHGHAIGRSDDPRVIGRSQAIVLLRDNLFDLGLERYLPLADPTRFLGALVDLFGRAKEEGIDPPALAAYAAEL